MRDGACRLARGAAGAAGAIPRRGVVRGRGAACVPHSASALLPLGGVARTAGGGGGQRQAEPRPTRSLRGGLHRCPAGGAGHTRCQSVGGPKGRLRVSEQYGLEELTGDLRGVWERAAVRDENICFLLTDAQVQLPSKLFETLDTRNRNVRSMTLLPECCLTKRPGPRATLNPKP
eukprot:745627-Prorocentrum_minimum.AAC.3